MDLENNKTLRIFFQWNKDHPWIVHPIKSVLKISTKDKEDDHELGDFHQ